MCRSEEDITHRSEQGFRVLTLGQDITMLIRALTASLGRVRAAPEPTTAMLPVTVGGGGSMWVNPHTPARL